MDARFNDIQTKPENDIFKVVFYPDRIYHAQYLNATVSSRYRYNVREVRGKHDINVSKGDVFVDGRFFTHFLRVEYRASRLTEAARTHNRFLGESVNAWIKLISDKADTAEAHAQMHYCRWIDAYQVELWSTLEGVQHDMRINAMTGKNGSITRVPAFSPVLDQIREIKQVHLAFSETQVDEKLLYPIDTPQWDNNFMRSFEQPRSAVPSDPANTVRVQNYHVDFQRAWFLQSRDIDPVRYRNPLMDDDHPERHANNVIEMRWLIQREFGGSVIYFHEVTIPPGCVEGTHQHIGSEELYYITAGNGTAYIGLDDDPALRDEEIVDVTVFGFGGKACRKKSVSVGDVIFTKSGGVHGIGNTGSQPLKFVAFAYHTS